MLEIGCANGSYLAEARDAGWTVSGIEFSPEAASAAEQKGFEVENTTIEAAAPPVKPYDLIVGWMVFEHVHHPDEIFRRLSRWVSTDGYLVLSVPDAGALEFKLFRERWYGLQLPSHMTHFTRRTITSLLRRSGWKVERVFWQRNPNNLLHSLRYWAEDQRFGSLAAWAKEVVDGRRGRWLSRVLAEVMAITRQSGRMTIWARRHDVT